LKLLQLFTTGAADKSRKHKTTHGLQGLRTRRALPCRLPGRMHLFRSYTGHLEGLLWWPW